MESKILIVDDQENNRALMKATLRNVGAELLMAESGKKALQLLETNRVFLALLDISMPEMDGFELAENIRKNSKYSKLPLIFLTASHKEKEHLFKGYELGVVDYMVRPVNEKNLINKVTVFTELEKTKVELENVNENLRNTVKVLEKDIDSLSKKREELAIKWTELDKSEDQNSLSENDFTKRITMLEEEIRVLRQELKTNYSLIKGVAR